MCDDHYNEGDGLWLGNARIPIGQGVSEATIHATEYVARGPDHDVFRSRALVIPDISENNDFESRPFAGAGGIRFYAGVPLVTKLGHTIGCYNVTSDEPRAGLSAHELRTLADMATIVMKHLEMVKNERSRARVERLISGIGSFIQGDVVDGNELPEPSSPQAVKSQSSVVASKQNGVLPDRPKVPQRRSSLENFKGFMVEDSNLLGRQRFDDQEKQNMTIAEVTPTAKKMDPTDGDHRERQDAQPGSELEVRNESPATPVSGKHQDFLVLSRASSILRKCLRADGVIFIDASAANLNQRTRRNKAQHSKNSSNVLEHGKASGNGNVLSRIPSIPKVSAPDEETGDSTASEDRHMSSNETPLNEQQRKKGDYCEIMAASIKTNSRAIDFKLRESALQRLVQRCPQGRCWSFNSRGRTATSDESSESTMLPDVDSDPSGTSRDGSNSARYRQKSRNPLLRGLPGAREIAMLPLWDLAKSRWHSCCIIWSADPTRLLNIHDDLAFLTAFGNAVMCEISRINLSKSDAAKANFLANVSHELRSPLHGILGSIEFLHDTSLDDFQSNMVINVETCGKTLLDTVDHVLDFAKLDILAKNDRKSLDAGDRPTNQLISDFDLATVVEEVVEAVYSGQVFRTANSDAIEGCSPAQPSFKKAISQRQRTKHNILKGQREHATPVSLTLNIAEDVDFRVFSQPGGIRRILMNLLGNALKYTNDGSIDVSLTIDPDRSDEGILHTCITVADTGIGISEDFVRNHAFTAFSQENTHSAGTGLGLSIVRQIVDSLGGKIDLASQRDVGTAVKIWLTLATSRARNETQLDYANKTLLQELSGKTSGLRTCLLTPNATSGDKQDTPARGLPTVEDSVRSLVSNWFHMEILEVASMQNVDTDFFIYAEPPPIEYLLDAHGQQRSKETPIIILCQNAFQAASLRADGIHHLTDIGRILEIISQPIGPNKLAKTFHRCMQRLKKLEKASERDSEEQVTISLSESEPEVSKDDSGSTSPPSLSPPGVDNPRSEVCTPSLTPSVDELTRQLSRENTEHSYMYPQRPPLLRTRTSKSDHHLSRVLVVDDNNINLQLLVAFVRRTKHPFAAAADGKEALDQYVEAASGPDSADNRFMTIFLDLSMPVMDGFEAARRIRDFEKEHQITPPAKIVALTGMGNQSNAQNEAEDAGFDLFLNKPIKFNALKQFLV